MVLEGQKYFASGLALVAIFALYMGHSKRSLQVDQVQLKSNLDVQKHRQKVIHKLSKGHNVKKNAKNKRVCVSGAPNVKDWKVYPDTPKIGKLIAELGFDLITGGIGGNMDAVREAFFNAKKDGQKSIWTPFENEKAKLADPPNVDEQLEPQKHPSRLQITEADMVISLAGGPGAAGEVKTAHDNEKPCFGVLPPDSVKDSQGRQVNKLVKDALEANGFKFVDDMDWEEDVDLIKAFLTGESGATEEASAESAGDSKKSVAFGAVPGSFLAFLTLGLITISQ